MDVAVHRPPEARGLTSAPEGRAIKATSEQTKKMHGGAQHLAVRIAGAVTALACAVILVAKAGDGINSTDKLSGTSAATAPSAPTTSAVAIRFDARAGGVARSSTRVTGRHRKATMVAR